MKKLIKLFMIGALLLAGCSTQEEKTVGKNTYKVVVSSFYEYDWLQEIVKGQEDKFEIELIMDSGVDVHSFEPSVEDIATISSSDLFIYTGGVSQDWVADVIPQMGEGSSVLNLMDHMDGYLLEETLVEGMQVDESHTHDHEHDEEHDHEEDHEHDEEHDHEQEEVNVAHADEHVWLSLHNAMFMVALMSEEVQSLDEANANLYEANAQVYIEELAALDTKYEEVVHHAPRDTLIFADRFAFLYMMEDYGINYYAAFEGCSAESEASFETIAFLAEKSNALQIDNILILEDGLEEVAQTVIDNSTQNDCEILELNAMQSIDSEDIQDGVTYLQLMEENLEVLEIALSK